MGVETIKSTCFRLRLHLYLLFSFVTESAAVTPHRKFWFLSFVKNFEAVPFLLLANSLLPLHSHCVEYLNYFALRCLQGEVKGITVGIHVSRDIYAVFSFLHQMSQSSVHLTPS